VDLDGRIYLEVRMAIMIELCL